MKKWASYQRPGRGFTRLQARLAKPDRQAGFSYLEVLIASAIITTVVAAGMNVLSMQTAHRSDLETLAVANELAAGMMTEIEALPFEEPDFLIGFGPENNQYENEVTAPPSRLHYDDIDDYEGWSASPPQSKGGTALTGLESFDRRVSVVNVLPEDLTAAVADGTSDIKRVTITVSKDGTDLVTLTRFRTRGQGEQAP